jgi:L-alanine-DL-glutamate epimerase-like enolase superfamily enzyme
LSAIDIALWDLLAKVAGMPLHAVLGGACREAVPVYNTCGNYGEVRDRDRFLSEPGALARELLDSGIRMMKVWPFDDLAARDGGDGQFISSRAIAEGVAWHLPVYLDEFVFRHNRRGTPMAAFQTLLGLGAIHDPTTYDEITALRRAA